MLPPSSESMNKWSKKAVFATCFMLNSFNGLHSVIFRKRELFAGNFRDCLSLFTSSTKLFATTKSTERAHAQRTHEETLCAPVRSEFISNRDVESVATFIMVSIRNCCNLVHFLQFTYLSPPGLLSNGWLTSQSHGFICLHEEAAHDRMCKLGRLWSWK
jgi:hypothetical protein